MLALKKPWHKEKRAQVDLVHLRKVSLFADIAGNEEALIELSSAIGVVRFEPGQEIMRENEAGSEMYILVRGAASVFKQTTEGELYRVTILNGQEHAFFGEGALLDADSRSATIRADIECECLVLDRESFESFGRENPQWAFPILVRIARAVMGRLRKSNLDLTFVYNALVSEIRGQ